MPRKTLVLPEEEKPKRKPRLVLPEEEKPKRKAKLVLPEEVSSTEEEDAAPRVPRKVLVMPEDEEKKPKRKPRLVLPKEEEGETNAEVALPQSAKPVGGSITGLGYIGKSGKVVVLPKEEPILISYLQVARK